MWSLILKVPTSKLWGEVLGVVVDATNLILGRMASYIAKRLLNGDRVVVINAEKAVISGGRRMIIDEYEKYVLSKRVLKNPEKGHKKVKRPDLMVKLAIRGMLPHKSGRGRGAYKRLKVYIGVPEEYSRLNAIKIEGADASKLSLKKFMTLEELALHFGRPIKLKANP